MPRRVRQPRRSNGPSDAELRSQIDRLARHLAVPPFVEGVSESPYGIAHQRLADEFRRERAQLEAAGVSMADQLYQLRALVNEGRVAISHLARMVAAV